MDFTDFPLVCVDLRSVRGPLRRLLSIPWLIVQICYLLLIPILPDQNPRLQQTAFLAVLKRHLWVYPDFASIGLLINFLCLTVFYPSIT